MDWTSNYVPMKKIAWSGLMPSFSGKRIDIYTLASIEYSDMKLKDARGSPWSTGGHGEVRFHLVLVISTS